MKDRNADPSQLLDATTALMKHNRRQALLSVARGEGIQLPDVLSGSVVILMTAAAWLDPPRAAISAIVACLAMCSVLARRGARQMRAVCALLEINPNEQSPQ